MTFTDFTASIANNTPPTAISIYLKAMWYDAKDDWHQAHGLVDQLSDATACWVHAYLHRKEGDIWNADYWYNRAKKTRPADSLDEEWKDIVMKLL